MKEVQTLNEKLLLLAQKEAEVNNLMLEVKELTKLKQQHPSACISFHGNRESQFVELEGSFTLDALREITDVLTHVPLEIRSRWNK